MKSRPSYRCPPTQRLCRKISGNFIDHQETDTLKAQILNLTALTRKPNTANESQLAQIPIFKTIQPNIRMSIGLNPKA